MSARDPNDGAGGDVVEFQRRYGETLERLTQARTGAEVVAIARAAHERWEVPIGTAVLRAAAVIDGEVVDLLAEAGVSLGEWGRLLQHPRTEAAAAGVAIERALGLDERLRKDREVRIREVGDLVTAAARRGVAPQSRVLEAVLRRELERTERPELVMPEWGGGQFYGQSQGEASPLRMWPIPDDERAARQQRIGALLALPGLDPVERVRQMRDWVAREREATDSPAGAPAYDRLGRAMAEHRFCTLEQLVVMYEGWPSAECQLGFWGGEGEHDGPPATWTRLCALWRDAPIEHLLPFALVLERRPELLGRLPVDLLARLIAHADRPRRELLARLMRQGRPTRAVAR